MADSPLHDGFAFMPTRNAAVWRKWSWVWCQHIEEWEADAQALIEDGAEFSDLAGDGPSSPAKLAEYGVGVVWGSGEEAYWEEQFINQFFPVAPGPPVSPVDYAWAAIYSGGPITLESRDVWHTQWLLLIALPEPQRRFWMALSGRTCFRMGQVRCCRMIRNVFALDNRGRPEE